MRSNEDSVQPKNNYLLKRKVTHDKITCISKNVPVTTLSRPGSDSRSGVVGPSVRRSESAFLASNPDDAESVDGGD